MADAAWEVREEGTWYKVTVGATCPRCGERFEDKSQRRKAAGPPDTPPLDVRVVADGTVELVATGFFLPVITHRCAG